MTTRSNPEVDLDLPVRGITGHGMIVMRMAIYSTLAYLIHSLLNPPTRTWKRSSSSRSPWRRLCTRLFKRPMLGCGTEGVFLVTTFVSGAMGQPIADSFFEQRLRRYDWIDLFLLVTSVVLFELVKDGLKDLAKRFVGAIYRFCKRGFGYINEENKSDYGQGKKKEEDDDPRREGSRVNGMTAYASHNA